MKNLQNLMFFFPKDTFTCEIVNILCLYKYFGLYIVPQTFRVIIGISPTAYSFSQLTATLTKRSSAFPTTVFPQQFFYSPQLTAAFAKVRVQPNTLCVNHTNIQLFVLCVKAKRDIEKSSLVSSNFLFFIASFFSGVLLISGGLLGHLLY
jgi:hypothetical protein